MHEAGVHITSPHHNPNQQQQQAQQQRTQKHDKPDLCSSIHGQREGPTCAQRCLRAGKATRGREIRKRKVPLV